MRKWNTTFWAFCAPCLMALTFFFGYSAFSAGAAPDEDGADVATQSDNVEPAVTPKEDPSAQAEDGVSYHAVKKVKAAKKSAPAPRALVAQNDVKPAAPAAGNYAPASNIGNNGAVAAVPGAPVQIKPYRTFITLMRYNMKQNGEPSNPISNVRLDITFPNNMKLGLPESGQFWPIGNGQAQEINRTYEVPWAYIQNDEFKFQIQIVRKGSKYLPCNFDVVTLSQFNRSYVCHVDMAWQSNLKPEEQDDEGIQIRVFTDKNSEPKDVPNDAIALK